jgi:uncharacterized protein (DUF849 family)
MTTAFQQFASDRVMIMSAPNGARRKREDHPALPISPDELAEDAAALRDAGVSVLHLHVRDAFGEHTLDVERYRQAISSIRKRVGDDLVLQVTTEAVGLYTASQQMAVVQELRPEAVSLALREICPDQANEKTAALFFNWMRRERIWPQYILYSVGDLKRFVDLRRRGIFGADAPFAMLVVGSYAKGRAGSVDDLDRMLASIDSDAFPWSVCCFGKHEHAVMLAALGRGGHVRLGFENNIVMADGTLASDNAALIKQFTADIDQCDRAPASAAKVRAAFCEQLSSR